MGRVCLVVWAIALGFAGPAAAVGVYDDHGRLSFLLRAPRTSALDGRAVRTDADGHQAALYLLSARFPLKSYFLIQPEVSFISLSAGDDIETGFGDFVIKVRSRLWSWTSGRLYQVSSMRTGSGKSSLFPYSTGSIDTEAGFGVVDSLDVFSWWASFSGTYVTRLHNTLENAELHGNFASLGGGIVLPLFDRVDFQLGGMGHIFRSGPSREVYFIDVDIPYSNAIVMNVLLQAEGGSRDGRAGDFAFGVGFRVSY